MLTSQPTSSPTSRSANGPGLAREPIAIVGIGCHLPGGAVDPDSFWELLTSKTDATRDIPEDRWDTRKFCDEDGSTLGKTGVHHGGFLDRIDEFDPAFFGISPREAVWLDPQQRLLLRVAWESIDDAGLDLADLAGTDVGVFVGGFTLDYQLLQNYGVQSRYELQAHSATGMMMTMLSNRISHAFDFTGPSLSIDTACSGSLVAVHAAAQSIWNGECSAAMAGGVNVMLAPNMTIAETKGGFLAPDGRCKTFDVSANGYARGEGAAIVLLKPLSAAEANGDDIYAVIRGSAVTQDGRTNGITVPNPDAQIKAMRAAHARAGVTAADVQYVEAHGTGTPVGDPLEATAIGTVLNPDGDRDRVVSIGSVKTNIGHLEAAAGVAGLIKTALALKHRRIPPHLHLHEPNPDVPLERFNLHVPTEVTDWPAPAEGPRTAGVNSFGFGGTNAHVVVSEHEPADHGLHVARLEDQDANDQQTIHLLPVSARSPEALAAASTRVADQVGTGVDLRDVAHSLANRRTHHEYRAVVAAPDSLTAAARLHELAQGQPGPGAVTGHVAPDAPTPKVAYVCSGMGPQWWGMGRQLYATEPVFAHEVDRVDAELSRYVDFSLVEEMMMVCEDDSRMRETQIAQPANFAIQVGLAALWKSRGIVPEAVLGHSTGEVASQYLSGVLSFTEAVKVTYFRSSLQQRATGTGRMLAVGLSADSLHKALRQKPEGVSVAAVNSPNAVTLSGDADVLADIAEQLDMFGVFNKFLNVQVPYHSPLMDPLREDLLNGLADLVTRDADIALYSTVTGTRIRGGKVDAGYWWQNVRGSVQFAAAFSELIGDGYTHIIEIGPHPVLATSMLEILEEHDTSATIVHSMYRGAHDQDTFYSSLGTLHCTGVDLPWASYSDPQARPIKLPSYPWQLASYWNESREAYEDRHYQPVHPLLGQSLNSPHPTWEIDFNPSLVPFVTDHKISGSVLLPGVVMVEMMRAAAVDTYGQGQYTITDIRFVRAVLLDTGSHPRLRTTLDPETGAVEIAGFHAGPNGERTWEVHATGRVTLAGRRLPTPAHTPDLDDLSTTASSAGQFYDLLTGSGFEYGPSFQTVHRIEQGPTVTRAHISLPAHLSGQQGPDVYPVHPVILDAALQVLLPRGARDGDEGSAPFIPVGLESVSVTASTATEFEVVAHVQTADASHIVSDVWVMDGAGDVVVHIGGFTAQSLEARTLPGDRADTALHHVQWEVYEPTVHDAGEQTHLEVSDPADIDDQRPEVEPAGTSDEPSRATSLVVLMDRSGLGEALCAAATQRGLDVLAVHPEPGSAHPAAMTSRAVVDPLDLNAYRGLLAGLDPETPARVVNLWPLDVTSHGTDGPLADQREALLSVVHLAKATYPISEPASEPAEVAAQGTAEVTGAAGATADEAAVPHDLRMWAVTRNAQSVLPEDDPDPAQAAVWGMSRVLAHTEMPTRWAGVIDLDRAATPRPVQVSGSGSGVGDVTGLESARESVLAAEAQLLLDLITEDALEDQIAVRGQTRYVPRLAPHPTSRASFPVRLDADATYLITGGLGALGRVIAADLARRGAGRIVLMGRSPLPEHDTWADLPADHPRAGVVADLLALETTGVTVDVAAVDASDAAALADWATSERRDGQPPVRGVIHAAGLVRDALVPNMSVTDFDTVLEPKVAGGWNLHTLFGDADLDFFILFSSTGAVIASPGQVNYAAGNAFLDALAAHRRAQGLPAVSVGWGPWSVGMVADLGLEDFYARRGIALIGPEAGRRIMDRVLANPPAHLLAISADWATARNASGGALPPMFELLGESEAADVDGSLLADIQALDGEARVQAVHAAVAGLICRVLGLEPDQTDVHASLGTLGMDSMMAIEVKQRLAATLGVEVSVLDLVQGASLTALADKVLALIGGPDDTAAETPAQESTHEPRDGITGLAGSQDAGESTHPAMAVTATSAAGSPDATDEDAQLLALLADASNDELDQLLADLTAPDPVAGPGSGPVAGDAALAGRTSREGE